MQITFFINYLNHHQMPVADEMYRLLGDDFHFVATNVRNPNELKGGMDYTSRPYCLLPAEREEDREKAIELLHTSDVCVFGDGNLWWERERAKVGKLSFEVSERWLKRGALNLLSPRLWKWWWLYQSHLRTKPFYKLCAGAFTASDCRMLLAFKNRCFKWGYFTAVSSIPVNKVVNEVPRIMWCARFIPLKHPELVVSVAERLQREGYDFLVNMYGDGALRPQIEGRVSLSGLSDRIRLVGNKPNAEVLRAMNQSDIFLFTSDRMEGWGAVVNEAMSAGCCVIGNNAIGSVPYLIEDGKNGLIYEADSPEESLYCKLKYALDNLAHTRDMGRNARKSLTEVWSPKAAAVSLLRLIDGLAEKEGVVDITEGPCSKAD